MLIQSLAKLDQLGLYCSGHGQNSSNFFIVLKISFYSEINSKIEKKISSFFANLEIIFYYAQHIYYRLVN